MREITRADSGKQLDVGVGETLKLGLPENATTGYRWQLRRAGGPVLDLAEQSFAPPGEAVGGSGMRWWIFRAALAGITNLELEQRRSWEHQTVDTFNLTVRVMAQ